MTFTVTDALMSDLGLKVLSGAGFKKDSDKKHIHVTYDVTLKEDGTAELTRENICEELGIPVDDVDVCGDPNIVPYATILDNNGGVKDWADSVTFSTTAGKGDDDLFKVTKADKLKVAVGKTVVSFDEEEGTEEKTVVPCANATVKLDFYVVMTDGASEIEIKPGDFGGFFYVEADTLYRNRDGKDMAATLTFPKVKVQSGFTIAMAANGDPSTFDFVMDAFPAYTYFDRSKKVVCDITIVSGAKGDEEGVVHTADNH